ncbi:hypothetical protein EDD16DRAFT_1516591 [Pisolithus croceorrhizus]|nr:hypothetical protein EDD16DRAFT_1516591 [Pisolithus croceorrhizus]
MDRPAKEMASPSETCGLAHPRYGVRRHSSWTGLVKEIRAGHHNIWTGRSMIWSEDGTTHGWASAANEMGWHSSWAGPSIVKYQKRQLMHWPFHDMEQHVKKDVTTHGLAQSIVKYQTYNSCTGLATIWSETGTAHGGATVAGEEGWHSSWAGPSIVKPQTVLFMHWPGHNVESDGATHGGASVAGGKGQHSSWAGLSIVKPQTVLFMHWPSHDVESDGATHGGASAAGGKGRRTSWAGPSIVKHQTVQLMHWPGNNMESDGATNGGASAAGEEGQHSSWAGPSIVKHQTIELMLWPSHNGESDGAAHGGASAAAVIWNEMAQLMEGPVQQLRYGVRWCSSWRGQCGMRGQTAQLMGWPIHNKRSDALVLAAFQSPAKSASASPQIMGGASAEGTATIWSEREIFCLSLISLSSSSFPVTSQICISIPADHGGASAEVTSQMCFGIPAVDGGACAADEGRGQSSWAGLSMINHPKIQLMHWHGCDMEWREIFCLSLISLSSSSFPVTSQMCFGIPAVDGGAGAAGGGGWQNSWACLSTANHQKIQLMHWRAVIWTLVLAAVQAPAQAASASSQLMEGPVRQYDGYVPTGWRMQLTDKIADYMKSRFREEVLTGQRALPDISIPLLLVCQADRMIRIIAQAYQNPDGSGNVNLWYLPGALDGGHQVRSLKFLGSRKFTFIPETNLEFTQQNGGSTEGQHKTFRNGRMAEGQSIIPGNGGSKR